MKNENKQINEGTQKRARKEKTRKNRKRGKTK